MKKNVWAVFMRKINVDNSLMRRSLIVYITADARAGIWLRSTIKLERVVYA